jgi:hypothetical protein
MLSWRFRESPGTVRQITKTSQLVSAESRPVVGWSGLGRKNNLDYFLKGNVNKGSWRWLGKTLQKLVRWF